MTAPDFRVHVVGKGFRDPTEADFLAAGWVPAAELERTDDARDKAESELWAGQLVGEGLEAQVERLTQDQHDQGRLVASLQREVELLRVERDDAAKERDALRATCSPGGRTSVRCLRAEAPLIVLVLGYT